MADIATLIEAEIPSLRRYARALTRTAAADAADDLVQDCLVRALAKRHLWQGAPICGHGCSPSCTINTSIRSARASVKGAR